ncbi:MAG: hypothetical protein JO057_27070 [Chloroflexi bacterium]|nr:hypothetical protein [Chloroflexota bacterium]
MASWLCVYRDRAGAHARASFDTKDLAKQFAERHARAVAPNGMLLKWEDAGDSMVLTMPRGDYLVVPADQH